MMELDEAIDFRALEHVSDYDSNLLCPICRSVFVSPVVIADCDHHFCRDCLQHTNGWKQYSGTCPACRRPGRLNASGSASKLLLNMLDELVVKCPNQAEGCDKQIKRGHVVDHVKIYCAYSSVECVEAGCRKKVRRRDAQQCVHLPVSCLACRRSMTVQELHSHWLEECPDHDVPCPFCAVSIPYRHQRSHLALDCPESEAACPAQPFGCPFTTTRKLMSQHALQCPLAQLSPFLTAQQERQDEQDRARQLLDKKLAVLQDAADSSKHSATQLNRHEHSYFADPLTQPNPPFPALSSQDFEPHASPTQHLLSLHENLREEVSRQANTIHDMDTRLSLMLLNENMRLKDELAYQGAQLSALMRQVGWLTNARLQLNHSNAQDPQPATDLSRTLTRMPPRRTTDEGNPKL